MGGTFKKVKPGSPLRIPAATWNELLDTAGANPSPFQGEVPA